METSKQSEQSHQHHHRQPDQHCRHHRARIHRAIGRTASPAATALGKTTALLSNLIQLKNQP
ncbi:hypothetical protein SynWH8103_01248 [Synechococcus sp. WH 8103]|nr:hypothetical protein SynWH8103_01248 [Synechococcus sp. WH 8103]